jgi:glycerol-3-phosphate dehydrogenase
VTLVGVWHRVWQDDPDRVGIAEEELASWLDEINAACPWLSLRREEVLLTQCGLVLFGENRPGAKDLSYGKRSLLVDHRRTDALEGLLTLIGVRYTTARAEADRAVRLVFRKLGRRAPRSRTAWTPLSGGDIECFDALEREARAARPEAVSDASLAALLQNHGSRYREVLDRAKDDPSLLECLPGSRTLRAELVHAVREEMAVRLEDVVLRRTDLGTAGSPGAPGLEAAGALMAALLGWSPSRMQDELARTRAAFPAAAASAGATSAPA